MAKKQQLGYREIEERLMVFCDYDIPADEVGYELLYSFGKSERDIERYKEGKGILKTFDGLLIKGLLCYRAAKTRYMTDCLERLKCDPMVIKAAPKIVAVSNGKSIIAYDMREKDTYENTLERLHCDFAFFYPLMDVERVHYVDENPADVKAAEKLAKLHDELRAYNDFDSDSDLHDLNIFITRLLFCFFAEDTGIFEEGLFTSSIIRYTKEDGSDLADYLDESFNVMDLAHRRRDTLSMVKQFPYVNGGLFSKHIQIPRMGAKARRIIIECGELNWKDINPDIFGSMIQAVVNPEVRATQGMHYTSVPNIMKVINPLFLDELRGEYNKMKERFDKVEQLWNLRGIKQKEYNAECKTIIRDSNNLLKRMSAMKFFDPACGSGNFLIITYKSLRWLEMDILKLQKQCQGEGGQMFVDNSVIRLDQFYGIELLDFPHEVAMLSLWLAEHQMNTKLNEEFGVNTKALPLKNITQIVCGNACRLDWNVVCPHTKDEEVFVFGNPPYLGSKLQSIEQKNDISAAFYGINNCRILDYICCWFIYGTLYIKESNAKFAFVTTNSICQGEQVGVLWPALLNNNVEILFAHKSFKWSNNAKYNAGVTCVIIGVGNMDNKCPKKIFDNNHSIYVNYINPYLIPNIRTIVFRSNISPKGLPKLCFGCMPYDDKKRKHLRLDIFQKDEMIRKYPESEKFIRKIYGSEEYINGKELYCLWIDDDDIEMAESIPPIKQRIEANRNFRLNESADGQALAEKAHQFREHPDDMEKIIIPSVSSENRNYIPIGFLDNKTIVSNAAFALYDAPSWLFGILTSAMHMVWVKTVGGRLETRYRYSAQLCYNTFPFPKISAAKKKEIADAAEDILVTREFHVGKTLAELYDPEKMPKDLLEAHEKLDDIVESCYPGYPFANDEARLECLFRMYEKMTSKKQ